VAARKKTHTGSKPCKGNMKCHAQLLAVTIRVIWLVGFSVEVVLPCLVQFIEDSIFWF